LDEYVGRWIFLNTTYRDFAETTSDAADSEEEGCEQSDTAHQVLTGIVQSYRATIPCDYYSSFGATLLSPTEESLLSYFVNSIGPQCSLSTTSDNPYLGLLMPMSFSSRPLRNALIAVAANQLRLLNDKRFEQEAWYHKMKAIQGISEAIKAQPEYAGAELVGTVLMLCFYDVSVKT
jgi:hypothetical protein